ncbi:single hybrid motif-containing protein [Penicillium canariense]|uniref:Lipoamide acyltransferase component of branched-chain alpha-keto acid dehydrogenase complex, mitochondrial n=1 Tax=Penicillium canariense TaxID=189055 RepID=A0A9W9IFQ0_9EURO|nr:single hybrid motif-containing protein [Penicillium canariense]KAJ5175105.1 single hybrid motif-containing protein [Penicillium canariense]
MFNRPRRCVAGSPSSLYDQQPSRFPSYNLFRPFSIFHPRYDFGTTVRILSLGGESLNEATVQSFNHKVGDYVEQHDVLAVIETDKVAMEVYAPETGVIQHIFVEEGDIVTVGQAIAEITVKSEPGNARNKSASSEK